MNARLLWNLAKRGIPIRVVSPRPSLRISDSNTFESAPDDRLTARFVPVPYIPKVGSRWNDLLMRKHLSKHIHNEVENFCPDLILGAWMYPDGCAVADLAKETRLPCGLIAQGTDLHAYLSDSIRKKKILRAVGRARITITRSKSLEKLLIREGADPKKVQPIYNGVDTQLFHPGKPHSARDRLNLPAKSPIVLFVGNLLPVKDPALLVQAVAKMEETPLLVIAGDGPLESEVRSLSANLGISDRVRLVGRQSPESISISMQAADLLCLSSRNEGLPNVILEAFASGLPVVATDVGGVSELVSDPSLGTIVSSRSDLDLSRSIEERLVESPHRQAIREVGKKFSWERSCNQYLRAFRQID